MILTWSNGQCCRGVAVKLGPGNDRAILTQWRELFRTALLAWGLDLMNPDPPFFHLTERGRKALAHLTRDPSNPAGYLRHVASVSTLDPVAESYLKEALDCDVGGLFKATAVMVGCSAESLILRLRDETVQKLKTSGKAIPKQLMDWKIKTVSDGLYSFFEGQKATFSRELRDAFEAYWPAFTLQIRTVRNDAGHPMTVDSVTPDTVHAALLIFPELARLATKLAA